MEERNYVEDILSASIEARGNIMSRVITLEEAINLFLSTHFCNKNNKTIEISEMVFSTTKITFDNKRDILMGILNKHYPEFLLQNINFNKGLQKIIEERNIFAHHTVDVSEAAIKNYIDTLTIQFLKYKNSKIPEPYSVEQLNNLMSRISKYARLIMSITGVK